MPVITVATHPIDQEKKTRLIKEITEIAVNIIDVPADKFVVFVDEYSNGSIGLAGKTRADIIAGATN